MARKSTNKAMNRLFKPVDSNVLATETNVALQTINPSMNLQINENAIDTDLLQLNIFLTKKVADLELKIGEYLEQIDELKNSNVQKEIAALKKENDLYLGIIAELKHKIMCLDEELTKSKINNNNVQTKTFNNVSFNNKKNLFGYEDWN